MTRRIAVMVVLLASVVAVRTLRAGDDPPNDITIIYDVDLREFTNWCSGIVTSGACAHEFHDKVHFYRGQTIHLVVRGAHLADLIAVELRVNELVEPTVPVFGALTELPTVKLIEPAESLVTTGRVRLAAGKKVIRPADDLYYFLDRWESSDTKHELQDYVKQVILDPTSTPEFVQLLGNDDVRLIALLNAKLKNTGGDGFLVVSAKRIKNDLDALSHGFDPTYDRYCPTTKGAAAAAPPGAGTSSASAPAPVAAASTPTVTSEEEARAILDGLARLIRIIERQRALLAEIQASGMREIAATVVSDVKLLDNPRLSAALDLDSCGLSHFWNDFTAAFPPQTRLGWVDRLQVDPSTRRYAVDRTPPAPGELTHFLDNLNAQQAREGATAASVAKLKKNLTVLFENSTAIAVAVARLEHARPVVAALCRYRDPKSTGCPAEDCKNPDNPIGPSAEKAATDSMSVYEFQELLDKITRKTIELGAEGNCVVQQAPLPASMAERTLGRWFGSAEVSVTVKQGTRVRLFDLNAIRPGDRLVDADTKDVGAPRAVQTSLQDLAAVRTGIFEIHNLYRFQLSAGFMASTMKDQQYQVAERTLADGKTTEKFFVQTRDRDYHFLPTIELMINFVPRDGFPWKPRYAGEPRPSWTRDLSALIGFSLSEPTKNFLFGLGWLPGRVGIGLKAGVHLGFGDALPPGVVAGQTLTAETTFLQQKLRHGYFAGATLEMQLFKDIFGMIFKP